VRRRQQLRHAAKVGRLVADHGLVQRPPRRAPRRLGRRRQAAHAAQRAADEQQLGCGEHERQRVQLLRAVVHLRDRRLLH